MIIKSDKWIVISGGDSPPWAPSAVALDLRGAPGGVVELSMLEVTELIDTLSIASQHQQRFNQALDDATRR
jgi:hypothetical protein